MTDTNTETPPAPAPARGGPKTPEGIERCKLNATRHGLRAVEIVVPGEDPGEWEDHRDAVVADLAPLGALELALAEQVAAKLWRLGRVVRHEADLIANAQAPDELARAHEHEHDRHGSRGLSRADIPTREDVGKARDAAEAARKTLEKWAEVVRQAEALPAMADGDAFPSWAMYEALRDLLRYTDEDMERLFAGEDDSRFLARHARKMMARRGDPAEYARATAEVWREKRDKHEAEARESVSRHEALARRYRAALRRRGRAHGLPGKADLDRILRYEAHLERGLHRDLDRLRELQSARGAAPPRPPTVAVAVVQAGPAPGAGPSPFGRIAIEAPGEPADGGGPGAEAGYKS